MSTTKVIPWPGDRYTLYPKIEETKTCKLLDWPIQILTYPIYPEPEVPLHPLSVRIAAVAAAAALTILSLGLYLIYAYRARTDRWVIHELFERVWRGDAAGVRELFDHHPELKTRKLMYAFNPSSDPICGDHSVFFYTLRPYYVGEGKLRHVDVEKGKRMIDELLSQGYDLNRPHNPGWILSYVLYARTPDGTFAHLLSKGAQLPSNWRDVIQGNVICEPKEKERCIRICEQHFAKLQSS